MFASGRCRNHTRNVALGRLPLARRSKQSPADVPHGRHRGVPTRGHPKGPICGFGAGHEIQDTLDIPQLPPGGRLLLVLDAIPVLGEDGLPVDNWTRPPGSWPRPPLEIWN